MTKFSKDNQPEGRGRPKAVNPKVPYSVSVYEQTKDYFNQHRGLAGQLLDEYAREKGGK